MNNGLIDCKKTFLSEVIELKLVRSVPFCNFVTTIQSNYLQLKLPQHKNSLVTVFGYALEHCIKPRRPQFYQLDGDIISYYKKEIPPHAVHYLLILSIYINKGDNFRYYSIQRNWYTIYRNMSKKGILI